MQSKLSFIERLRVPELAPSWPLSAAIIFAAAYVVMSIAGQIIAATLTGDSYTDIQASTLAFGGVIGALAMIAVLFLWARRRLGNTWLRDLHLDQTRVLLFAYVMIGLAGAWAIDLLGRLLAINAGQVVPAILSALGGPIGLAWGIAALLALVLEPLAETIIFQGILYPALARDLHDNRAGIVVTALVYAIVSLAVGAGTGIWYLLLHPFLMALVITAIRAYTQALRPALAARAMFGLFFIFSALVLKV